MSVVVFRSSNVLQTQEFASRIHAKLWEKMPVLMFRMHRRHNSDAFPLHSPLSATGSRDTSEGTTRAGPDANDTEEHRSWPAAQTRLATAFERDGLSGWADAMAREVETEAAIERCRRGSQGQDNDSGQTST